MVHCLERHGRYRYHRLEQDHFDDSKRGQRHFVGGAGHGQRHPKRCQRPAVVHQFGAQRSGQRHRFCDGPQPAGGAARRGRLEDLPVPALAAGAVIPPNRKFLALLGDQGAGTNVEAPLATIRQAMAEVLAGWNGANDGQPINVYIGEELLDSVIANSERAPQPAQRREVKDMDILTIGGVTLPAPNEYKVQLNDLDSSDTGRTEDGVMMRNRVREGIAKISASWAAVSTADCAADLTCGKTGKL